MQKVRCNGRCGFKLSYNINVESDFNTRRVIVVVNPGDTRAAVSIPIVNDNRLEAPETFRVMLSIGQNSEGAVIGQSDTAEVVILSDDSKSYTL